MTDVAQLRFDIDSRGAAGAASDLDRMNAASQRAERQAGQTARAMNLLRGAMGLLGLASLSAGFLALRRATLDYSAAMREVATLVDRATVSMDELSGAAIRQAAAFNSTPLLQAQALYQIISAGATSAAEATDILTASNKLAVGGVTTVAIAADGLTSILNAYGDQVAGATDVSDALFTAMRAGKTTIEELSSSLGQVSPLAAQVGVSFDELAAATAALTKGGISTSVAVTGLRAILAAVARPSAEATKLAEQLGLEFNSTALQAKGLQGFLADLATATGGNVDQLGLLFGGVEALVPMLALAGGAGEDFNAIMEQMGVKAGATERAFEEIASGPAFQVGRIFSTLGANALAAGNAMLQGMAPAIRTVDAVLQGTYVHAELLSTAFDVLLVAAVALAVRGMIPLTAAIVAKTTALITGSAALRAYAASVALVGPVSATATVAITGFAAAIRAAMALILGPWGLAIAAAVTALAILTRSTEGAQGAINDLAQTAGAGGARYLELKSAADQAAAAQDRMGDRARGAAAGMADAINMSDQLRRGLVALGIEADYTANRLALLGLREAQSAHDAARERLRVAQEGGGSGETASVILMARELQDRTRDLRAATQVASQSAAYLNEGLEGAAARAAAASRAGSAVATPTTSGTSGDADSARRAAEEAARAREVLALTIKQKTEEQAMLVIDHQRAEAAKQKENAERAITASVERERAILDENLRTQMELARLRGDPAGVREAERNLYIRERSLELLRQEIAGTEELARAMAEADWTRRDEAQTYGRQRDMFARSFSDGVRAAPDGDLSQVLNRAFGTAVDSALNNLGGQIFDSIFGAGRLAAEGTAQGAAIAAVTTPAIITAGTAAATAMGTAITLAGTQAALAMAAAMQADAAMSAIAPNLGGILNALPGFETGGSIMPSGSGASDSQLVAFWKSPRERVDIGTPEQLGGGGRGERILRVEVDKSEYFDVRVTEVAGPVAHAAAGQMAGQIGSHQADAQRKSMYRTRR